MLHIFPGGLRRCERLSPARCFPSQQDHVLRRHQSYLAGRGSRRPPPFTKTADHQYLAFADSEDVKLSEARVIVVESLCFGWELYYFLDALSLG